MVAFGAVAAPPHSYLHYDEDRHYPKKVVDDSTMEQFFSNQETDDS